MITPRHKPLPILRPGTKPPRLDLIDALAGDLVVLGDASALYFRISFFFPPCLAQNPSSSIFGLCDTYLVESAFHGAVECSTHYFPGAMDGGGGGFYRVVGLLCGWDCASVCGAGRGCCVGVGVHTGNGKLYCSRKTFVVGYEMVLALV